MPAVLFRCPTCDLEYVLYGPDTGRLDFEAPVCDHNMPKRRMKPIAMAANDYSDPAFQHPNLVPRWRK